MLLKRVINVHFNYIIRIKKLDYNTLKQYIRSILLQYAT